MRGGQSNMPKRVETTTTPGFKQKMALGISIADGLDEVTPRRLVARQLGISKEQVRRIEYLALAKLAHRMRELERELA